ARFCADAFATDPDLAADLASACRSRAALGDEQPGGRLEELASECRYPAARCAALAGCGLGEDGAKLGAAERARWRQQARQWLEADLSVWAMVLDIRSKTARDLAKTMLTRWQADPGLAGLREPSALEKFSADERKEWLALWQAVDALLGRAREGQ